MNESTNPVPTLACIAALLRRSRRNPVLAANLPDLVECLLDDQPHAKAKVEQVERDMAGTLDHVEALAIRMAIGAAS